MITTIVCPFCNKELELRKYSNSILCTSHGKVETNIIYNVPKSIVEIILHINSYSLYIFCDLSNEIFNNKMHLFKDNVCLNTSFMPIDNNLTPENIEQKIKTYLIFQ